MADEGTAVLRGETLICVSSIDWDFNWQGHQEIMSALAAQGNAVLFMENTGVRAPRLRDLPRLRARLRNWRRGVQGFREERPGLFVYSPLVVPLPYARPARWLNRWLVRRALRRWLAAVGSVRPIVWTFLPTPLARDLVRDLDPELTVYYCVDDLPSSSAAARRVAATENELFRTADLVLVTAERLRERAARYRASVHLFPFGVSYEKFARARGAAAPVPDDVNDLPRPLIGYVGGLNRLIDQELLVAAAQALPEATFVFVGPLQQDLPALRGLPNARLLGPRPHDDLPHYIKAFDVGLVPYLRMEYTSHIYPTKLNEYLAMGIPVASTDLFEVLRLNDEQVAAGAGPLVHVGSDAAGFVAAIRAALADRTAAAAARRIAVAESNSWTTRIARMSALVADTLARRRAARPGWQVSLRQLYRRGRRRVTRTLAGLLAAYVLVFYSPLAWLLASPLRLSEAPRAADAIVVFAGGVGESGKAGGGYQERVKQAIGLYRAGWAPVMVFSSGYVFAFREAEVMRDLAISQGVPASAIVLEDRATSTYENVVFVAALLRPRGARTVLLVSSPYHMRRAIGTWRKQVPEVVAVPTPVPSSQFYAHRWGASLEQVRGLFQEAVALAVYRWRGWT